MGLETGTEGEDKNSQPNKENDALATMAANMELMKQELQSLKEKNLPQQISAPGGMSGEQFAELLATVVKATKEKPDDQKLTVKTFVDERDIDKDDFDEKGVIFCAYSTGYLIVDDVRQGFPVSTPFGNAIFFKYEGKTESRDGKGKVVLNTFCVYQSRSKKEQEWLRGHRYFGIKFFESAKEALSTDAERAQKLVRFIDSVMSLSQDQAVIQCKAYGVPISSDMRTMRISLASRMLDKIEQGEKTASVRAVEEFNEERLFLGDASKTTPVTLT